jgi:hypothetical protein
VLDDAQLRYLLVPLDPAWRLAVDRHPNARGAHAIAAAIAQALARTLQHGANPASAPSPQGRQ